MGFESWRQRAAKLEREVHTLYLAFRDSRTPLRAKAVIALIVAYAISPIDPIPDVIPGVGYLDELVVLPVGIAIALRLIPEDVMTECRQRAGDEINVGPARWLIGAIVIALWIAIAFLALRLVTGWI